MHKKGTHAMSDIIKRGDILVLRIDALEKLFDGEVLELPSGCSRIMIQQLHLDILEPLRIKRLAPVPKQPTQRKRRC